MAYRVGLDLKAVTRQLEGGFFEKTIIREFQKAIGESAVLTRNAMSLATPTGESGLTANSWQLLPISVFGSKIRGGAVSSSVAAIVLNKGAKRHRPPRGALLNWIRRKLPRVTTPFINRKGVKKAANLDDQGDLDRIEFAITAAIKRRGLPRDEGPIRIYDKAFDELEPKITKILMKAAERVEDAYED